MTPSEAAKECLPEGLLVPAEADKVRERIRALFLRAYNAGVTRGTAKEDSEKFILARRVLGLDKLVKEVKRLMETHEVWPEDLKAALAEAEAKEMQ